MYTHSDIDMSNNTGTLIQHYNKTTKKQTTFITTAVDISQNSINENVSEWGGRPINYFREVDNCIYNTLHYQEIYSAHNDRLSTWTTYGSWILASITNLLHSIDRVLPIDQTQFVVIEIVEHNDTVDISQYTKDGHLIGEIVTYDREDLVLWKAC